MSLDMILVDEQFSLHHMFFTGWNDSC